MTAAKKRPAASFDAIPGTGNGLRFRIAVRLFRFLFADGTMLDVEAVRDDSILRGAVIDYRKRGDGDRIEGVADLGEIGYFGAGVELERETLL